MSQRRLLHDVVALILLEQIALADPNLRPTVNPSIIVNNANEYDGGGGGGPVPQSYIIGGSAISQPSHHQWFAAARFTAPLPYPLSYLSSSHAEEDWLGCGASLIAPRFVVTSAHCLWDPRQHPSNVEAGETRTALDPIELGLEYRIGFRGYCPEMVHHKSNSSSHSAGGDVKYDNCGMEYEDIPAVSIHLHPNDVGSGAIIDLALVELAHPSTIAPVKLDYSGTIANSLRLGDKMTVLGAGKTSSPLYMTKDDWDNALPDILQTVEVGLVNVHHCIEELDLLQDEHEDSMICSATLGSDRQEGEVGTACHGDSGGPLFMSQRTQQQSDADAREDILLGVVSVGKLSCNGEATAYTKVSYASGWMCSIWCGSEYNLSVLILKDCPDWCRVGDNEKDGGGGASPSRVETKPVLDEPDNESLSTVTSQAPDHKLDCDTEGDLEYMHKPEISRTKTCRWLGQANRSLARILRICQKTDALDICKGTCSADDTNWCRYPSK